MKTPDFSKKVHVVFFNHSSRKWVMGSEGISLRDYCYKFLQPRMADSLSINWKNGRYEKTATEDQLLIMLQDADARGGQERFRRFDSASEAKNFYMARRMER